MVYFSNITFHCIIKTCVTVHSLISFYKGMTFKFGVYNSDCNKLVIVRKCKTCGVEFGTFGESMFFLVREQSLGVLPSSNYFDGGHLLKRLL